MSKASALDTGKSISPFCSKRCQLIDLGEWAAEEKAIPSDTADFAMDPNLSDEWVSNESSASR